MAGATLTRRRPEVLQRAFEAQRLRCREELRKADHFARLGDVVAARQRFDRVRAIIREARVPADLLNELKEAIRQIEITGLKKLVDQLLDRASDLARVDNVAGRAAVIDEAREHISRILALGADPDFAQVAEKKIEIAMMTSSREAAAAPKEYATPRATTALDKAAVSREQRRFKRFTYPRLLVEIEGRRFLTLNWSIGGLAIMGWPPEWQDKKRIDLTLSAESDDASFHEVGTLLCVFGEARNAAVQFDQVHSKVLQLIQRLTAKGRSPRE